MDDADLYSDLYGTEYEDLAATAEATGASGDKKDEPAEQPAAPTSTASAPSTQTKPPASTASTAAAPAKSEPVKSTMTASASAPPIIGNSIATYSSRDGESSFPSYGQPQQQRFVPQHNVQQPQSQPTEAHQVATFEGTREGEAPGSVVRPSDMRDEGKMFVGGLNWETTTESLTAYFSQFGKIDACTIMRDGAGRSRGFAFLTFEDAAAVNAVMVKEHILDGKIIDPKRAIPRLEHQRTQKLFVGGLAPSVTAETLKSYFSQHGSVIDATVMVDRESGRSKGFGFVTFEEGPSLDHLLGHGIVLDGKVIEVKLAQPRHTPQRQQGREGGDEGAPYRAYNNNQNTTGGPAGQAGAGGAAAPFDAQAMANLYQRMMSVAQTGGFMGMGGGMPMGGMGGGMGMGGMGRGMGMGMAPGMGMGMGMGAPGMGMMPQGGGMGRGAPMMGGPAGGMGGPGMGGPPRGPRAGVGGGLQGQQGGPAGGAGPMRSHGMRGQNTYHPYGR